MTGVVRGWKKTGIFRAEDVPGAGVAFFGCTPVANSLGPALKRNRRKIEHMYIKESDPEILYIYQKFHCVVPVPVHVDQGDYEKLAK